MTPKSHLPRYLRDSHARGAKVDCRKHVLAEQGDHESDDPGVPRRPVRHDWFRLSTGDAFSYLFDKEVESAHL